MTTSLVSCEQCRTPFQKENKEINRAAKTGALHFCNNSCSGVYSNGTRRAVPLEKVCPYCHGVFMSTTKARAATFCSHRCATLGSETDARREARAIVGQQHAGNLLKPARVLKLREAWKYILLEEHLANRPHEFEYAQGDYVFDLALFDTRTFVEFDGPYHNYNAEADAAKEAAALETGFTLVRRAVQAAAVIPLDTLQGL